MLGACPPWKMRVLSRGDRHHSQDDGKPSTRIGPYAATTSDFRQLNCSCGPRTNPACQNLSGARSDLVDLNEWCPQQLLPPTPLGLSGDEHPLRLSQCEKQLPTSLAMLQASDTMPDRKDVGALHMPMPTSPAVLGMRSNTSWLKRCITMIIRLANVAANSCV
jgi:hypothetical protein